MVLSPALEKLDMRESLGLHFRDDVKFVLLIFFAHNNTPVNWTVPNQSFILLLQFN